MPNRLAQEASTYLQQHADNPVDWWPWCPEALALARDSSRPILLSIGYAACHWCHVMAHESFEDADTAAVMNAQFVNIKVDRQERPDLDQVYQSVHQVMTGRPGGWPLTVFLAADLTPIHAGTYFPKAPRFGLPGFVELLHGVAHAAHEQSAAIAAQGAELSALFARQGASAGADEVSIDAAETAAQRARDALMSHYDSRWGGFGGAPKFPQPSTLGFLLHRACRHGDQAARDAVLTTLRAMACSGLNDPLAGGFFRYSVDARWEIPHFEKMLYDNVLLLPLYAEAWALTAEPLFAAVCTRTVDWLLAEMQSPAGGFYAALDADSDGAEGRYYVWQREEVQALLDPADWPLAALAYGLDAAPNFEGEAWHFAAPGVPAGWAAAAGFDPADVAERLPRIQASLACARAKRTRPTTDRQRLTAWNALAISGLVTAGGLLGRDDWIDVGRMTWRALVAGAWHENRWQVTADPVPRPLPGYLDDYAFTLAAALDLLAERWDGDVAAIAETIANRLIDDFQDADGYFHMTSASHERLLFRPGGIHDQALPAGAPVALMALETWGACSGSSRYQAAAARGLRAHFPDAASTPAAAATFWRHADQVLRGTEVIVIGGPGAALAVWRRVLSSRLVAGPRVIWCADDAVGALPAALAKPPSAVVQAWWCAGGTCFPPIGSVEVLMKQLETLRCNMK